jgi:hypothetical protein
MVIKTQAIISLEDLRYVSIECPLCKTSVTLDMKETLGELPQKYGFFAPKDCPGCKQPYDTAIRPSIDGFRNSYRSLLEIADRVTFRSNNKD